MFYMQNVKAVGVDGLFAEARTKPRRWEIKGSNRETYRPRHSLSETLHRNGCLREGAHGLLQSGQLGKKQVYRKGSQALDQGCNVKVGTIPQHAQIEGDKRMFNLVYWEKV